MDILIEMDDLGVPPFMETSRCCLHNFLFPTDVFDTSCCICCTSHPPVFLSALNFLRCWFCTSGHLKYPLVIADIAIENCHL